MTPPTDGLEQMMATLNTNFAQINQFNEQMSSKINGLNQVNGQNHSRMNMNFDQINSEINGMNQFNAQVNAKITGISRFNEQINSKVNGIDERFVALEAKQSEMHASLQCLNSTGHNDIRQTAPQMYDPLAFQGFQIDHMLNLTMIHNFRWVHSLTTNWPLNNITRQM